MEKQYATATGGYGNEARDRAIAQAPSQGLVSDAGTLPARLVTIRDRVTKISEAIHGHYPRAVGDKQAQPPQEETLRRHIDTSHRLLGEIEDELLNIEQRL